VTQGAVLAGHVGYLFGYQSGLPSPSRSGPRLSSMMGRPELKEARARSSPLPLTGVLHARDLGRYLALLAIARPVRPC